MPFNGSGTFLRVRNWVNDATAGIKIRADRHDSEDDNLALGLSQCITKDGQTTITANLPMATFRHTNVGLATARTQYARYDQVYMGKYNWSEAGGAADALTATNPLSFSALTDGMEVCVRITTTNETTMPTLAVDGLDAATIVRADGSAVIVGELYDGREVVFRYSLNDDEFYIVNDFGDASFVKFDNTESGLTAETVQDAIDELESANGKPLFVPVFWPWSTKASNEVWVNGQTIGDVDSGADIEDAEFEALFDLLVAEGSTYGNVGDEDFASGDTVKLPDYREVVIAGLGTMGGVSSRNLLTGQSGGVNGDTLGAVGGEEETTPTEAKTAIHDHPIPAYQKSASSGPRIESANTDSSFQANVNSNNAGSSEETNNVQPTLIQNFVMRYK